MRILVADSTASRGVLCNALRSLPGRPRVEQADDGLQALALLEKARYDLVVCDHATPFLRALELLQRMRCSDFTASIPMVVVSNRTDAGTVSECWKAGAQGFMARPFNPEDVLEVVRDVLLLARRNRQPVRPARAA